MAARRKPREVETSMLIQSINWKEELLLQKRLIALDTVKKQVADSYTLDQSVLFNRFRNKLRHSELVHARLMERREVVERLKTKTCGFNALARDDSKTAVREILQRASSKGIRHNIRRQNGPIRSRPSDSAFLRGPRTGTAVLKGAEENRESQIAVVTPVSTALPMASEGLLTQRPYTVSGATRPPENTQLQTQERRRTAGVKFVGLSVDSEQRDTGGRRESQRPKSSYRLRSGRRNRDHKRESALSIFLKIGEREEIPSLLEIHARFVREAKLDETVQRFLNELQTEQQSAAAPCDHYAERLLATLTARDRNPAPDTDLSGWDFVGKEKNYRSITFKKLDMDYFSNPSLAGDLVLYNLQ